MLPFYSFSNNVDFSFLRSVLIVSTILSAIQQYCKIDCQMYPGDKSVGKTGMLCNRIYSPKDFWNKNLHDRDFIN